MCCPGLRLVDARAPPVAGRLSITTSSTCSHRHTRLVFKLSCQDCFVLLGGSVPVSQWQRSSVANLHWQFGRRARPAVDLHGSVAEGNGPAGSCHTPKPPILSAGSTPGQGWQGPRTGRAPECRGVGRMMPRIRVDMSTDNFQDEGSMRRSERRPFT